MPSSLVFCRSQLDELHARPVRARRASLAHGVERLLQEGGVGDAGDLDRILEGQEDARGGPLLGRQLQQVLALVEHLALGHLVALAAGQDVGQGGFARAVRPHDGVHLARG